MAYQALYRKYRPMTFDEIVGQDSISSLLKRQAADGKVSHAYLFTGTRGTGKTTSAKVLAKAVNCENPVDGNPCNQCWACRAIDNASATDVLELDAASNNKVENIREVIDEVVYPPTAMKKRVYIIDEVHMLTDSAFNALLKTLEEPPEYVLFILATTELNELPATIVSRCMRFDFRRIEPEAIAARARFVADSEGISISDEALMLISKLADGSARDALSLLDACAAWKGQGSRIELADVRSQLGITDNDILVTLFSAIRSRDIERALGVIRTVHSGSADPTVFLEDMICFVRDSIIAKNTAKKDEYLRERFFFSTTAFDKLAPLLSSLTTETLLYYASVLEDTLSSFARFTVNKRTLLDLAVIKLCDPTISFSMNAVTARISELERVVAILSVGEQINPPAEKRNDAAEKHSDAAEKRSEDTKHSDAAEMRDVAAEKRGESAEKRGESAEKSGEAADAPDERKPFKGAGRLRELLADQPAVLAIISKCRILIRGSVVTVEGDAFSVQRLSRGSYLELLQKLVSAAADTKVTLEFSVVAGTDVNSDSDPFNEIIQNGEES